MFSATASASAVTEVRTLIEKGRFAAADTRITARLAHATVPASERQSLEFERERMRRILLDFTLSAEDVKSRLRRHIPDLKPAEFARWDAAGLLERMQIDGRTLY